MMMVTGSSAQDEDWASRPFISSAMNCIEVRSHQGWSWTTSATITLGVAEVKPVGIGDVATQITLSQKPRNPIP